LTSEWFNSLRFGEFCRWRIRAGFSQAIRRSRPIPFGRLAWLLAGVAKRDCRRCGRALALGHGQVDELSRPWLDGRRDEVAQQYLIAFRPVEHPRVLAVVHREAGGAHRAVP
jgi:hypothetical protein